VNIQKKQVVIGLVIIYIIIMIVVIICLVKNPSEEEIETYAFDKIVDVEETSTQRENENQLETTVIADENNSKPNDEQKISDDTAKETTKENQTATSQSVNNNGQDSAENSDVNTSGAVSEESNYTPADKSNNDIQVSIGTSSGNSGTPSADIGASGETTDTNDISSSEAGQVVQNTMNLVYEYGDGICAITEGSYVSGDVILPDTTTMGGVTYQIVQISNKAFAECSNLISIHIGQYVKIIAAKSFMNCKSLTTVTFPADLQAINYWAFNNCKSLGSLSIPSGTTVDKEAFINCPNVSY
jgi:hypothetical protein